MRYAQIVGNTVHGVFEYTKLPEFASNIVMVKLPKNSPVESGWQYTDGEFVEPPAPELLIPQEVTMRQARLALHRAGILNSVNSAIAAMQGEAGEVARIEWEFSATMRRDRPFVLSIGTALGLSEEDIDNLFIDAANL